MSHESFLHKLANHILSHYNLTNQDLTVVFPNKRAAFYLRNEFKKASQETLWLPRMVSIEDAVAQWSGIELADDIEILFELIDIDAQLHVEQSSDLSVFGSQASQMAKDFDEIDKYGIDAQHVFNYVIENKRLEFWNFDEERAKEKELKYLRFFHSLYQYYLRLREVLSTKGKGYYGMITRHLANLPEEELLHKIGETKVIFAGFNAMTKTEEQIVDTLIKNGRAEILFDYDHYYLDNPSNEAGFFARKHLTHHPEWLKNGISDALLTEEKHIHIISTSGNTLQTKALQAKLQENQRQGQVVILADQNLLIPTLNAIPDAKAYQDFKVSMGYPLAKTPVNQLIKEYFSLHRHHKISRKITENGIERAAEGWYIWPILHLMELEIIKIAFPDEETAAFSQLRIKAVNAGKFIFEDNDIEALNDMPNIRKFLKIILIDGPASPLTTLHSIKAILEFLASLIQTNGGQKETIFLLNQVSSIGKIVSRLQQIVENNSQYICNLQSLEILYRLLTTGASLKLNSSSTDGLQIMGLLETRNLDFERLHLLSVNEGILPPDKSQGSFIPQYIRRECGLPGYAESQAVVAYHFYHLLQNGKDIYLYFNNLGETSGGEASRFILQIKHELAKNANIHFHEESFVSLTTPSIEVKALSAEKDDDTLQRLHYLIENEAKGLSPSSLSTYLNCPLKYFLKYVAQIEDNSTEEDVGVNIIGTIIHDTLEFLFADYLPQDGKQQIIDKTLFDEKIKPLWKQKLTQAIEQDMPNGLPDVGFNYLNHVTIEQQLKSYLNYTSNQLKNNDLIILETEGKLTATLPSPYDKCRFAGRTDRIDRFGNIIRVIDYKTGHVDDADLRVPVRHLSESDLDYLRQIPDKALQLLLYKYMYLKGNPSLAPEQVTGAIHGLRYTRNIEFGLSKVMPKKGDNDADANFLDDSTFLDDMERLIEAAVTEMLDTATPFVQAQDDKKCRYCDFKGICKR